MESSVNEEILLLVNAELAGLRTDKQSLEQQLKCKESELTKQYQRCLKLEAEVVTFQYENEMQNRDIKESEVLVSNKDREIKDLKSNVLHLQTTMSEHNEKLDIDSHNEINLKNEQLNSLQKRLLGMQEENKVLDKCIEMLRSDSNTQDNKVKKLTSSTILECEESNRQLTVEVNQLKARLATFKSSAESLKDENECLQELLKELRESKNTSFNVSFSHGENMGDIFEVEWKSKIEELEIELETSLKKNNDLLNIEIPKIKEINDINQQELLNKYNSDVSTLESKLKCEYLELVEEKNTEIDSIKNSLNTEIQSLLQEKVEVKNKFLSEIDGLEISHKKEIVSQCDRFNDEKNELIQKHNLSKHAEINELKKISEEKYEQMKDEYEQIALTAKNNLIEQHTQILECKQSEFNSEIQELNNQFSKIKNENTENVNSLNLQISEIKDFHANNIKSIENEYLSEKESLLKEHANVLKELTGSHLNDINTLKETHSDQISKLIESNKENFEIEMGIVKNKYEEDMKKSSIESDRILNSQKENFRQENETNLANIQKKMKELTEHYEDNISSLNERFTLEKNNLEKENEVKLIAMTKDNESNIENSKKEISELKKSHENNLSILEAKYHNEIQQLRQSNDLNIEELNTESQSKLKSMQEESIELKNIHIQEKNSMNDNHKTEIQNLIQANIENIDKLNKNNANMLDDVEKKMCDLKEEHDKQLSEMLSNYTQENQLLIETQEVNVKRMKNDHNSDIQDVERQMKELSENHDMVISSLNDKYTLEKRNLEIENEGKFTELMIQNESVIDNYKKEITELKTLHENELSTYHNEIQQLRESNDLNIEELNNESQSKLKSMQEELLELKNVHIQERYSMDDNHKVEKQNLIQANIDLKEDHDKELSKMLSSYTQEKQQLIEIQEVNVKKLQVEHNADKQELEKQMTKLTENHMDEIACLNDKFILEKHNLKKENDDKFTELTKEYESNIENSKKEISELKKNQENKFSTLEAKYHNEIQQLHQSNDRNLEELNTESQSKLKSMQEELLELKNVHIQERNSMDDTHKVEKQNLIQSNIELKEMHDNELSKMLSSYTQEKQELIEIQEVNVKKLQVEHNADKQELEKQMTKLTENYESEIACLNDKFILEKQNLEKGNADKFTELTNEYESNIENSKKEISELKKSQENKFSTLEAKYHNEIQQLRQSNDCNLEELNTESQSKLKSMQEELLELKNVHIQERNSMDDSHKVEKQNLIQANIDLKEDHDKELSKMLSNYTQEKNKFIEIQDSNVEKLKVATENFQKEKQLILLDNKNILIELEKNKNDENDNILKNHELMISKLHDEYSLKQTKLKDELKNQYNISINEKENEYKIKIESSDVSYQEKLKCLECELTSKYESDNKLMKNNHDSVVLKLLEKSKIDFESNLLSLNNLKKIITESDEECKLIAKMMSNLKLQQCLKNTESQKIIDDLNSQINDIINEHKLEIVLCAKQKSMEIEQLSEENRLKIESLTKTNDSYIKDMKRSMEEEFSSEKEMIKKKYLDDKKALLELTEKEMSIAKIQNGIQIKNIEEEMNINMATKQEEYLKEINSLRSTGDSNLQNIINIHADESNCLKNEFNMQKKKLINCHNNEIANLNDEITRQVNSIAALSKKHEQEIQEMKTNNEDLLRSHSEDLNVNIDKLKDELLENTIIMKEKDCIIECHNLKMNEIAAEVESLKCTNKLLQETEQNSKEYKSQIGSQLTTLQSENKDLESKNMNIKNKLDLAKKKTEDLSLLIEQLNKKIESTKNDNEEKDGSNKKNIASLEKTIRDLKINIEDKNLEIHETVKVCNETNSKFKSNMKEMKLAYEKEKAAQKQSTANSIDILNEKLKSFEHENSEMKEQLQDSKSIMQMHDLEVTTMQADIENHNQIRKQLNSRILSLEAENDLMIRQQRDAKREVEGRRVTLHSRHALSSASEFAIESPAGRPFHPLRSSSAIDDEKSRNRRQTIAHSSDTTDRSSVASLPPSSSVAAASRRLRSHSHNKIKQREIDINVSDGSDSTANDSSPTKSRKTMFDNFNFKEPLPVPSKSKENFNTSTFSLATSSICDEKDSLYFEGTGSCNSSPTSSKQWPISEDEPEFDERECFNRCHDSINNGRHGDKVGHHSGPEPEQQRQQDGDAGPTNRRRFTIAAGGTTTAVQPESTRFDVLRESELHRRNRMQLPHMKSSYPAENEIGVKPTNSRTTLIAHDSLEESEPESKMTPKNKRVLRSNSRSAKKKWQRRFSFRKEPKSRESKENNVPKKNVAFIISTTPKRNVFKRRSPRLNVIEEKKK